MPLMGSLYVGASGLQTSQNALNTTAHNLTNVDTKGYTRQQVQQSDRRYVTLSKNEAAISYKQTGLGVVFSRAKQVRDYFLDKTYRKESGRSMFYQVSTDVMEEVEGQLGEMNGEAFQTTLADFWTSVQELAKDPTSSVTQGLLVQRAAQILNRADAVYEGLSSYQDNLNAQVKQQVDKINKYGKEILTMNDQIRSIESGGVEHANDLRDSRNQLMDELAELTNMTWEEDIMGNVAIQIEGVDFVKGSTCYEIQLNEDERTGFLTPFWPQNAVYTEDTQGRKIYNIDGAEVFDLSIEISADLGTDVGGLKAMLLARGDHRADYSDIDTDYSQVSQSVIMNIQSEFDQLIHNVVTKVNDVFAEAAGQKTGTLTLADGTVLNNAKYCDVKENGYLRNEDGSPIQLFTKISSDEYKKVTATNEDGVTAEYWVYQEEKADLKESLYSIKNLMIDTGLMQKPAKLGLRLENGAEDYETAEKLKNIFTEEVYTLNPDVKKKTNFLEYYDDLVAQVSNSGYVYKSIYENQVNTVEATFNAREQVIGVSSDEELANMIKFQNAYNASSRYINVISDMIEHLLNSLGA